MPFCDGSAEFWSEPFVLDSVLDGTFGPGGCADACFAAGAPDPAGGGGTGGAEADSRGSGASTGGGSAAAGGSAVGASPVGGAAGSGSGSALGAAGAAGGLSPVATGGGGGGASVGESCAPEARVTRSPTANTTRRTRVFKTFSKV